MIGRFGIITPDGYPRIVPVNFVSIDDNIYFHGASEEKKYFCLQKRGKFTFAVDKEYSYLPSY